MNPSISCCRVAGGFRAIARCSQTERCGTVAVLTRALIRIHISAEVIAVLRGKPCQKFSGRVYFSTSLPWGMVHPSGADLSAWVTCFVKNEKRGDVLHKLAISGAKERHVCILLSPTGRRNGPLIYDFLSGGDDLPTVKPGSPATRDRCLAMMPSGGKEISFDKGEWSVGDSEAACIGSRGCVDAGILKLGNVLARRHRAPRACLLQRAS
jgi:hypothetical protein